MKDYLQILLTLSLYALPIAIVVYVLDRIFNS